MLIIIFQTTRHRVGSPSPAKYRHNSRYIHACRIYTTNFQDLMAEEIILSVAGL
jgi:hypothetical protein